MDRVQSYTSTTALSATPPATAGASVPILPTIPYIKPGPQLSFSPLGAISLPFSASVFAAVTSLVLLQTKPVFTLSSTFSKLFCCPVNSPQACSAGLRPAHAPAPEFGGGLLPPSPSLGAAGEARPAAPLTQGAWAQASSAQHKVLMRSAVNLTPEGCSHRHPAVINSQRPRGQSLR